MAIHPDVLAPHDSTPTASCPRDLLPDATMPNRFRARLKDVSNQTGICLRKAMWQTSKCILWTVCSPCICCLLLFLPHRHGRTRPPLFDIEPPMMPTPRRRALSISRELQPNQLTVAQPQSTFINKLPLEIRRMIYEKALGEQPIHTTVSDGKLVARRCGLRNCTCYLRPCPPGQRLHLALPLLRTCRQM